MMTKTAVLFDVGGVLFSPPQRAIAAYERELGLSRGTLGYVFIHGAPENAFCRMERGELTLSQFFPEFEKECHELAKSRDIAFTKGFSARELFQIISSSAKPIPEMIDAVERLKKAGFKTCAITNNWIDDSRGQPDHLHKYLGRYFDTVLESCKLGVRKPDVRIYQMACERLGVHPSECVFLDDLGTNLKAAKELGMTTIKVQDPRTALEELGAAVGMTFPTDEQGTSPQERGRLESKL